MSFSAAAATELQKFNKASGWAVEWRTAFAPSSSWAPVPWLEFSYRWADASPIPVATVDLRVANTDFLFTPERSTTNRGQLLAELRITATIGAESDVLFQGRLNSKRPEDHELSFSAQDWASLAFECEAPGQWEPGSVEVVDDSSTRQIFLLQDGALGLMYGFESTGGSDPAFDSATRSRRRALQPTVVKLYYDSGGTEEVPGAIWRELWPSGCIQILEDPTGKSYYVRSVRAYLESAATEPAALPIDWAVVLSEALQVAKADGGVGADPSEIDIPDFGLDLPAAFRWPRDPEDAAFLSDLVAEVQRAVGQNLRLWYCSRAQQWKARLVTQKAPGSEDFTLYAAQSVSQPLDIRGLATRVVATGKTERPLSALAYPEALGLPAGSWTDLTGGATWSKWNGADVESSPSGFADSIATLADGNHQIGPLASSIPGSYPLGRPNDWWVEMATRDFGEQIRCDGLRLRAGGSRCEHPLVSRGHYFVFWPGYQLLVSDDNSTWFPLAPEVNKVRLAPFGLIELFGAQITRPNFRYLKLVGGLYKFGINNSNDPGWALSELELFVNSSYRVVKTIQNSDAQGYYRFTRSRALPVTDVNTGAKTFKVAGDHSGFFLSGVKIAVAGSTGNDRVYTLASDSSFSGGKTTLTVAEVVASGVADGDVITDIWPNYYPELHKRFGNRGRTLHLPLADRYNERLAHDYALQRLAEGVRLFGSAKFRCAHEDARPQLYDTLAGPDAWNGDLSFLCEGISIDVNAPGQPGQPGSGNSEFSGTDYRAEGLSNS